MKRLSVIITAAGNSSRMTAVSDKLLADLCGKTVLERTVEAFNNADTVDEIIIVTREEKAERIRKLTERYKKVTSIVPGGATRALSVEHGMKYVSEASAIVSIHDGARPFITSEEIDRLHTLANDRLAVCCGKKVRDTVKSCINGRITGTQDRETLILAQTPQIFDKLAYKQALTQKDNSRQYTDDCSIMEAAGFIPEFAECAVYNEKITTDEDLLTGRLFINKGNRI